MLAEQLRILRQRAGKSQQQVADELGINRSTLADYERGTYEPGVERLTQLARYYKVSLDELVQGSKTPNLSTGKVRVLAITTDAEGAENIQYVPQQARAGYLSGYADREFIAGLPQFRLPNIPAGSYRAFEIKGDSMPPIPPGSIVIGRYVEQWQDVKDGERYILITADEGIVFKRVKRSTLGALSAGQPEKATLISDNPEYAPYQVPVSDILEAWSFYAFIGFAESFQWGPMEKILEGIEDVKKEVSQLRN